ncbi:MAG: universal stress protein, partial [Bacteroidota bacterium]
FEDQIEQFKILPLLYLILKSFNAKLRIVHIETGIGDLELASQVKYFFDGFDYDYVSLPETKDLNQTINQFVEEQQADMLCMIRRKRSFFQKIFTESSTTKEVFHTKVPLLVMKE